MPFVWIISENGAFLNPKAQKQATYPKTIPRFPPGIWVWGLFHLCKTVYNVKKEVLL